MMVSANDAAYAVAETVGGSISGFAADLNATAQRYGMRDSTFGDPAGLTDAHVVRRRPEGQRVRPRDRGPQRARPCPRSRSGPTRAPTTSPTRPACTTQLDNHNKFLPGNGFGYEGANGFKTGLHRGRRPHARRHRQAQRPPVHRGDPRIVRQRLHVGGVAARQVLAEAGRRDDRHVPAAGRGVAVRRRASPTRPAFANLAVGSTGAALAADDTATPRPRRRRTTTAAGARRDGATAAPDRDRRRGRGRDRRARRRADSITARGLLAPSPA